MKICVLGTGYVGLVSGTCFADLGNHVVCMDTNLEKFAVLESGKSPFYEPGLSEQITRNVEAGRLCFSASLEDSMRDAQAIFIAVGTPPLESGAADLSAVFSVAEQVFKGYQAGALSDFKVLVTKSTVPVGTGDRIKNIRAKVGLDSTSIGVMSNPEFLREGTAIYDFFHPDRIVIGGDNDRALDVLSALYDPLYRRDTPIVRTDIKTAELSKYASNAFLATKISFINEMANLCERTGADVKDISKIMGMDGRIGKYFLHAGPGYGGSCFPKDTKALVHLADELEYDLKIVKAVEEVNERQKQHVITHVLDYFGPDLTGKKVALLGLAFKSNTDDIRESSALAIAKKLMDIGASVTACDPEVKRVDEFSNNKAFSIKNDAYDAAQGADAVILVTEWNAYRELDLVKLRECMNAAVFFDLRNVYAPEKLQENGFEAYVIGRQLIRAKEFKAS